MKTIQILSALLLLFICSCSKEKVKMNDTPECFTQRLSDPNYVNLISKMDQYTFQGKTVYAIEPADNIADGATEVIDENCNKLGFLGGLKGNTEINGEDFSNAVFIKNSWKK